MSNQPAIVDDQALLKLSEERVFQFLLSTTHPRWEVLRNHAAFTENWIVFFLKRAQPVPDDAYRQIFRDTTFRKNYRIRLAMLRCRTAPHALTISLVHLIRWVDLYQTLKLPNLPGQLKRKIEERLLAVLPRLGLGEKISLARQAPKPLIRHLRLMPEPPVIKALLNNYFFTYEDALFMANFPKISPQALQVLAQSTRWSAFREIRCALLRNPKTPQSVIMPLANSLREHDLHLILRDPRLTTFARRQLQNILGRRFQAGQPKNKQNHKKGAPHS